MTMMKKNFWSIILVLLLMIGVVKLITTFLEISGTKYEGDNGYDYFLNIEIGARGYDSAKKAMEAKGRTYAQDKLLCEMETIRADVEQMVNAHKDFLDLDKKYKALSV